jgi:hypothetical protein
MDTIGQQIEDMLSGRTSRFKRVEQKYPDFQVEVYGWSAPFKEGGSNSPDETIIRVSTKFGDKVFYETYVRQNELNLIPKDAIIKQLKQQINLNIMNYCSYEEKDVL